MSTVPLVFPNADILAKAVAARLALTLVERLSAHSEVSLVLTGGSIATRAYGELRDSPLRDAVDWPRVSLWWGDERFLPTGHPDRNETQAREALLNALPLDESKVHPMPASDGPDGEDPEAAAARYARHLAPQEWPPPSFDLVLLGVGPDGHIASIFPNHPSGRPTTAQRPPLATAVRHSPKPPPTRVTLTLPVLNAATEIWIIAAGEDKAAAVAQSRATVPSDAATLPVGRVRGRISTVWMLDRAAFGAN